MKYDRNDRPESAARFARRISAALDSLINFALMIPFLLMLAFAVYALWDSQQISSAASRTRFEIYKPTAENSLTFEELREKNPEVIGWISVYGTNIDYPLVSSSDGMKYINTAADGSYSLSGAIFLDSLCPADFSGYSSVIHGHNMAGDVMFGQLKNFKETDYFASHRYGNLYYGGKDHGLEIFEYLEADAYDFDVYDVSVSGKEEQTAFLNLLKERAVQYRQVGQEEAEKLVLLSTCALGYTNGRDILVCTLTDQTFEADDPQEKAEKSVPAVPEKRKDWNGWERIPLWIWSLIVFGFTLFVYIIYCICCKIAAGRRARQAEAKKLRLNEN